MKVKVFDCEHEKDLEELVNNFLEEIKKDHYRVRDIKYSTNVAIYESDQIYIYSALIMYEPDDKIIMVNNTWGGDVIPL